MTDDSNNNQSAQVTEEVQIKPKVIALPEDAGAIKSNGKIAKKDK